MPRDESPAVTGLIRLEALYESPTNHRRRKGFEEASLRELANSIQTVGILQPILVRPVSDGYEIVAGARRFRAAKLAGLTSIPAIIRELTDVEVLELQVVENSQREDPHPLDEAEGYQALCEAAGYSVEQLAARLGKSRSHVYSRLALAKLDDPIKEKFAAGEFGSEIAGLIARLPAPLQAEALDAISREEGDGVEVESFRKARDILSRNFLLRLAEAPFDIETDLAGAGPCTACPKRTSCQSDLFADITLDRCLDRDCFERKSNVTKVTLARATKDAPPQRSAPEPRTKAVDEQIRRGNERVQATKKDDAQETRQRRLYYLAAAFDGALNGENQVELKLKATDALLVLAADRLDAGDGTPAEILGELRKLTAQEIGLELLADAVQSLFRVAKWDDEIEPAQMPELQALAKRLGIDLNEEVPS